MKAFVSRTADGIDSLRIEDLPPPGPLASGQIRILMRAASVNYRDTAIVSGAFGLPGPHGLIPCSDGTGEIIEIAADVLQFKVGDRIALIFNPDWIGGPFRMSGGAMGLGSSAIPGTMREEIVAHHSQAVLLPAHLSFEEGAAYPCAGVTAWHALCGAGVLMPGMSVLLQGGGGVSMLALQFAKMFGARVIMTSSSAERCASLKQFGADDVIDYGTDRQWSKSVRALTGGAGVDLTIDIGGADTVEHSLAATRNGGRLALVGILTGWPNTVSSLFTSGVEISPVKVGSREDYENLNRAVAFHRSRPVLAARYRFEQLPEALHHLKSGRHVGKIVIGFP